MGDFLAAVVREINDNIDCGYKVAGVAVKDTKDTADIEISQNIPLFRSYINLLEVVRQSASRAIIVAMDERRGNLPVNALLDCRMNGIPIIEGETFFEELTGKLLVDKINPSWLIFKEGFNITPAAAFFKRVLGALISVTGLLLTCPLLLLVAVLIKIDSPGPVFFTQERVGKRGEVFSIVKFRSMKADAEKYGAKWAGENDDRVTRVGRVIRKLRIDEIPQMWNVLKGDMNFVGPRPERPVFVSELSGIIRYYKENI
jgi:hypothetical protein